MIKIARLTINEFVYDTETGNILLQIPVYHEPNPADADYDQMMYAPPTEYYLGQLFLDGELKLVGKYVPPSKDGTRPELALGESFGRHDDVSVPMPEGTV